MTFQTERTVTVQPETTNKPPPQLVEERDYRLFQTMDGLRDTHGSGGGTRHRILRLAAALIGGSLVFAALYAVILFFE